MNENPQKQHSVSRRSFLATCAAGSAALATTPLWSGELAHATGARQIGPAGPMILLDQDWLFAGKLDPGNAAAQADETTFEKVTLPHCVTRLSWQNWDADAWQHVWLYRRHFTTPVLAKNERVFLRFEGVMVTADVSVNGAALPTHQGGYLPFKHEITSLLQQAGNTLNVEVDARFQNVPPEGSPSGPVAVDYFLPGGIIRGASLSVVPEAFLDDVFAKPVDVLKPTRRVEVFCSIDAGHGTSKPCYVEVSLMQSGALIARKRMDVVLSAAGKTVAKLTLSSLGNIRLWDVDTPHLYDVVATLFVHGKPVHDYRRRIGFREAAFTVDGFFLNGRRLHLFGLNRHELYPYTDYAMPARVMRRDAEIIRHELNCNTVRCAHYPQSEAFLEACDELGLMVWEETPGWQYVGNEAYQDLVTQNVGDMIVRDRNHASIIIWRVRVNESADVQPLYRRTTALAKSLDDSRPASGSMTHTSKWETDWHEDVFALDDYHSGPDGSVQIYAPLPGVPYMLAETVGQRTYTAPGFGNVYRRAGDVATQCKQALYHAQAHDRALAA